MANKFKIGVSDWHFIFSNNRELDINTVSKETIKFLSTGQIVIKLTDVTIKNEFINDFREGTVLLRVDQIFDLKDNVGETLDNVTYNYYGLVIKYIRIKGSNDSVSTLTIKLSNY